MSKHLDTTKLPATGYTGRTGAHVNLDAVPLFDGGSVEKLEAARAAREIKQAKAAASQPPNIFAQPDTKPAPKSPNLNARLRAAAENVEPGRYAVCVGGDGSKLHFFQIDKPTEGKWAGWVFIKEQAGDETFNVRGPRALEVVETIALDPHAALIRYGREIGVCGRCGRTLTDEDSRAAGIGPVCAAK